MSIERLPKRPGAVLSAMKIVLVHNYYQQPGGEDQVFAQELRLLESHGHEVVTYSRSNKELLAASPWERLLWPKRLIWAEDAHRELLQVLRREEPAIVHVHNTFVQISPSIFSACREARVPVVQTLHNFRLLCPAATFFRDGKICEECREFGLWRGIRHACYRHSTVATAAVAGMLVAHRWAGTWGDKVTAYIALTQFARSKFIAGGLPAEKIKVKPNFAPSDPGVKEGAGEVAVFVGRLSPEKGVKTLLEAWGRLAAPIPLRILGDGPLRGELQETKSRLNLPHVDFLGQVSHPEVQKEIKNARFLVLPSECYENFPMTIVEAFSCGTPIVCSRLGAMQEIVTDLETGLHFAPGNPDDLAEKVTWAWNRPRTLEDMGRAARCEYKKKYTAEANYATLMEIYREAIAGTGLSAGGLTKAASQRGASDPSPQQQAEREAPHLVPLSRSPQESV
jgi:glycosyltransferase involved in cell wall biosynthesis